MHWRIALGLSLFPVLALAVVGCGEAMSAPIPEGRPAYEIAGEVEIPKASPADLPGLHNLYRLSDNIVSGAEPEGEEAFKQLADLGVKTILSVDGKAPDAETARKYGIRYVHVPIQYSAITKSAQKRIAKTFRELPGPFYVHCYHGKHRGPAAAAVGRIVLDGAPRETAIAEMRQWCGTSEKYGGLYEAVARAEMPDAAETESLDFDFPARHAFKGFRHGMIRAARVFDRLKALEKRDWTADPEHPDIDAKNEAEKLVDALAGSRAVEETSSRPEDFRRWLGESVDQGRELVSALKDLGSGDSAASERADAAFKVVKNRCSQCHTKYRNH